MRADRVTPSCLPGYYLKLRPWLNAPRAKNIYEHVAIVASQPFLFSSSQMDFPLSSLSLLSRSCRSIERFIARPRPAE